MPSNAIIRFDVGGNLNLYGNDDVLTQIFLSSETLKSFRTIFSDFNSFARYCPEMVEIIYELLPTMPEYVADLPTATRKLMQEGKLFLRPDKEGKLLATLINPDNQRIVKNVRLKEVQQVPAINDMMFSLSFMSITQQLNEIQESLDQLRQGQIRDRETDGTLAAQYLQWAADESNQEKRTELCEEAHRDAVRGFLSCLNTVNESAEFFLSQPSADSLAEGIAKQVMPWNWGKTFQAATQALPRANELRRAVAKCTYCTQYASASSFMIEDRTQVIRDLNMYAEHMSLAMLGKKASHLKPWLSPKTLEVMPFKRKSLPDRQSDGDDIISFIESTVSQVEEISKRSKKLLDVSSDQAVEANEPSKE